MTDRYAYLCYLIGILLVGAVSLASLSASMDRRRSLRRTLLVPGVVLLGIGTVLLLLS
jgi:uncharacterized SAM-binding protein YcdF (DUF218 family)